MAIATNTYSAVKIATYTYSPKFSCNYAESILLLNKQQSWMNLFWVLNFESLACCENNAIVGNRKAVYVAISQHKKTVKINCHFIVSIRRCAGFCLMRLKIWSPTDGTVPAQVLMHSQFIETIIAPWILNEKIPFLSVWVLIQFTTVITSIHAKKQFCSLAKVSISIFN